MYRLLKIYSVSTFDKQPSHISTPSAHQIKNGPIKDLNGALQNTVENHLVEEEMTVIGLQGLIVFLSDMWVIKGYLPVIVIHHLTRLPPASSPV